MVNILNKIRKILNFIAESGMKVNLSNFTKIKQDTKEDMIF